ncbi:MAG: hypothetical protein PHO32_04685, partial [Candidatus Cloacimonetes bacterium]|nr:hypothetical protein [Candidatus Cloacimonadota bacterium]
CMVKLALHIRPHQSTNNKKPVLQVTITENGKNREMSIMPDSIVYLPADKQRILNIQPLGKSILQYDSKAKQIQTELPVLIDTRKNTDTYCPPLEHELGLYKSLPEIVPNVAAFCNETTPETGSFTKMIHLPYKGDVMVETGDSVIPDDIVASNKFAPPRLFIVNPYLGVDDLTEDLIRSSLLVSAGDIVDFDTPLRQFDTLPSKKYIGKKFPSPIRGKLEFIDYSSGILVLSEIQDYSSKPVTINLAEQMGCKPRLALRYLKKNLGEFVHQGDVLAKRLDTNDSGEEPCFVKAPSTGEIYEINTKTAEITIQYKMNPHNHFAHVHGTVSEVQGNDLIVIDYQGTKLEGKLGVGICTHGEFIYLKTEDEIDTANLHEKIVAINACADTALINKLIKYQVKGLICPGLNQTDLVTLLQKELGVVNTGNESLPLCVVITDSFGAKQFSKSFCETLKLATGKHCYLEPHTRIRAGVARPFICFM